MIKRGEWGVDLASKKDKMKWIKEIYCKWEATIPGEAVGDRLGHHVGLSGKTIKNCQPTDEIFSLYL